MRVLKLKIVDLIQAVLTVYKLKDFARLVIDRLHKPVLPNRQSPETASAAENQEHNVTVDNEFLNGFLDDAREGRRWCDEAAMHWAEILTFPFAKMIITFDLGVLAFIGAVRDSFFSQGILIFSVICAAISLLILTFLTRSVIVKNINSLAERKRILNYTVTHAPIQGVRAQEEGEMIISLMERQGRLLKENLDGLDMHVKYGMPWQKIGIYLFYASVVAVLVGIVL